MRSCKSRLSSVRSEFYTLTKRSLAVGLGTSSVSSTTLSQCWHFSKGAALKQPAFQQTCMPLLQRPPALEALQPPKLNAKQIGLFLPSLVVQPSGKLSWGFPLPDPLPLELPLGLLSATG
jgi:hypothetical protein